MSQYPAVGPMLIQCWSTVYDAGPTLDQHRANVLCLLDSRTRTPGTPEPGYGWRAYEEFAVPIVYQCWDSAGGYGPALRQRLFNVSIFSG